MEAKNPFIIVIILFINYKLRITCIPNNIEIHRSAFLTIGNAIIFNLFRSDLLFNFFILTKISLSFLSKLYKAILKSLNKYIENH